MLDLFETYELRNGSAVCELEALDTDNFDGPPIVGKYQCRHKGWCIAAWLSDGKNPFGDVDFDLVKVTKKSPDDNECFGEKPMINLNKEYQTSLGLKVFDLHASSHGEVGGKVEHVNGEAERIWWDRSGKALEWCLGETVSGHIDGSYNLIEVQDGRHEAAVKEQASEWLCHNDDVIIRKADISCIEREQTSVLIYTFGDGDSTALSERQFHIKCATEEEAKALMQRFKKELK